MKTAQTLYILSLMYLQSFWLRNMHLKTNFLYRFDPEHQKLMWCDKAKNETGSSVRRLATLGTCFAFFILCLLLGKHLFQELRKAIDFNKALIYRFLQSHSFFLFCLPLTLSWSNPFFSPVLWYLSSYFLFFFVTLLFFWTMYII